MFGAILGDIIGGCTDGYYETVDVVKDFIRKNGYTFPVYYDSDYSASEAYDVESIPRTLVIDKNGKLVDKHVGSMSESTIRSLINKIY